MNQQIKEIALECYNPYTEFDHEKFAKLIVQACADILVKEVEVALDANGNPVSPEDFILEHFGVES